MITIHQFMKLFPEAHTPQEWVDALNHFIPLYDVENEAAFISQCGHECQGFTRLSENLNYSAEALIKTWPTRFTTSNAAAYARQPEKIANKVYCDRLGNGSEASGDGWRYRGAGCIQLTGKANQGAFAAAIKKTLPETAAYLQTIQGGVESACWYWQTKQLNKFVTSDMSLLTRRINGGMIGYKERQAAFNKAKEVMSA